MAVLYFFSLRTHGNQYIPRFILSAICEHLRNVLVQNHSTIVDTQKQTPPMLERYNTKNHDSIQLSITDVNDAILSVNIIEDVCSDFVPSFLIEEPADVRCKPFVIYSVLVCLKPTTQLPEK